MKFIPYKPLYLDKCVAIYNSNCPPYFLEEEREDFISFLQANEFPYWLVEVDKKRIGCGGIYISNADFDRAEFENEVGFAWGMINYNYHKQGYGKGLSLFRINYLKQHFPKHHIVLRTTQLTYRFFETLGFKTLSISKNGYGKGMDKYVMTFEALQAKN